MTEELKPSLEKEATLEVASPSSAQQPQAVVEEKKPSLSKRKKQPVPLTRLQRLKNFASRVLVFHFHSWGKWSDPIETLAEDKKQQWRVCKACNKAQNRTIKDPLYSRIHQVDKAISQSRGEKRNTIL